MKDFRRFIEDNLKWFEGSGHETDATLDEAERRLSVKFPEEVRWLLKTYGYGPATGICSLEDTVADTLAAREHLALPDRYIVLYDHQDGGVILLDTEPDPASGQHRVYNAAWQSIPDGMGDEIIYPSYAGYVTDVMAMQDI